MKQIKRLVFYELNPRFFKDTSGNGVGDLLGIYQNFDYFDYLNVDAIILQNVLLSDSNDDDLTFNDVDPIIGNMEDMVKLLTLSKKKKKKILIEINIGTIQENHTWFKLAVQAKNKNFSNLINFQETKEINDVNYAYNEDNKKYYILDNDTQEVPINWDSSKVIENFMKVIRFWNKLGISGFVIKKFEYLADESKKEKMSEKTLKLLRKFYCLTKEINDDLIMIAKTNILENKNINKYAIGDLKVFDYVLSTKISIFDLSEKYFNDAFGSFSPKVLCNNLKQIASNSSNIITFGSNLSSRALSRWMNDGQYIEESAKLLGMLFMLNKGSSSIYMGEEIGMPNIGLTYLDDFQTPDLEERKKLSIQNRISEKEFLKAQVLQNPINSRSLMSWNNFKNGGFSKNEKTITPVMTRYKEINVKNQFNNVNSVLNFYRELIRISRHSSFSEIFQKGEIKISSFIPGVIKYKHIFNEKEIKIIVNLTDSVKYIKKSREGKVIISTYIKNYQELPNKLEAFEGVMISKVVDKYIKTPKEKEIEKRKEKEKEQKYHLEKEQFAKKQQIERLQQEQELKDKAIKDKIKLAQKEERAKLFAKQKKIKIQEKANLLELKLKKKEQKKLAKEKARVEKLNLLKEDKINEKKHDSLFGISSWDPLDEEDIFSNPNEKISKRKIIEYRDKIIKKEIEKNEQNLQSNIEKTSEFLNINKITSESLKQKKNINKKLGSLNDFDEPILDDDFEQIKENAKIDRNIDNSYLDEKTKLQEEELAKTTLIDDTSNIDEILDDENKN